MSKQPIEIDLPEITTDSLKTERQQEIEVLVQDDVPSSSSSSDNTSSSSKKKLSPKTKKLLCWTSLFLVCVFFCGISLLLYDAYTLKNLNIAPKSLTLSLYETSPKFSLTLENLDHDAADQDDLSKYLQALNCTVVENSEGAESKELGTLSFNTTSFNTSGTYQTVNGSFVTNEDQLNNLQNTIWSQLPTFGEKTKQEYTMVCEANVKFHFLRLFPVSFSHKFEINDDKDNPFERKDVNKQLVKTSEEYKEQPMFNITHIGINKVAFSINPKTSEKIKNKSPFSSILFQIPAINYTLSFQSKKVMTSLTFAMNQSEIDILNPVQYQKESNFKNTSFVNVSINCYNPDDVCTVFQPYSELRDILKIDNPEEATTDFTFLSKEDNFLTKILKKQIKGKASSSAIPPGQDMYGKQLHLNDFPLSTKCYTYELDTGYAAQSCDKITQTKFFFNMKTFYKTQEFLSGEVTGYWSISKSKFDFISADAAFDYENSWSFLLHTDVNEKKSMSYFELKEHSGTKNLENVKGNLTALYNFSRPITTFDAYLTASHNKKDILNTIATSMLSFDDQIFTMKADDSVQEMHTTVDSNWKWVDDINYLVTADATFGINNRQYVNGHSEFHYNNHNYTSELTLHNYDTYDDWPLDSKTVLELKAEDEQLHYTLFSESHSNDEYYHYANAGLRYSDQYPTKLFTQYYFTEKYSKINSQASIVLRDDSQTIDFNGFSVFDGRMFYNSTVSYKFTQNGNKTDVEVYIDDYDNFGYPKDCSIFDTDCRKRRRLETTTHYSLDLTKSPFSDSTLDNSIYFYGNSDFHVRTLADLEYKHDSNTYYLTTQCIDVIDSKKYIDINAHAKYNEEYATTDYVINEYINNYVCTGNAEWNTEKGFNLKTQSTMDLNDKTILDYDVEFDYIKAKRLVDWFFHEEVYQIKHQVSFQEQEVNGFDVELHSFTTYKTTKYYDSHIEVNYNDSEETKKFYYEFWDNAYDIESKFNLQWNTADGFEMATTGATSKTNTNYYDYDLSVDFKNIGEKLSQVKVNFEEKVHEYVGSTFNKWDTTNGLYFNSTGNATAKNNKECQYQLSIIGDTTVNTYEYQFEEKIWDILSSLHFEFNQADGLYSKLLTSTSKSDNQYYNSDAWINYKQSQNSLGAVFYEYKYEITSEVTSHWVDSGNAFTADSTASVTYKGDGYLETTAATTCKKIDDASNAFIVTYIITDDAQKMQTKGQYVLDTRNDNLNTTFKGELKCNDKLYFNSTIKYNLDTQSRISYLYFKNYDSLSLPSWHKCGYKDQVCEESERIAGSVLLDYFLNDQKFTKAEVRTEITYNKERYVKSNATLNYNEKPCPAELHYLNSENDEVSYCADSSFTVNNLNKNDEENFFSQSNLDFYYIGNNTETIRKYKLGGKLHSLGAEYKGKEDMHFNVNSKLAYDTYLDQEKKYYQEAYNFTASEEVSHFEALTQSQTIQNQEPGHITIYEKSKSYYYIPEKWWKDINYYNSTSTTSFDMDKGIAEYESLSKQSGVSGKYDSYTRIVTKTKWTGSIHDSFSVYETFLVQWKEYGDNYFKGTIGTDIEAETEKTADTYNI